MGTTLSTGSLVKSYDLDLVSVMLKWPAQYTFPGTHTYSVNMYLFGSRSVATLCKLPLVKTHL